MNDSKHNVDEARLRERLGMRPLEAAAAAEGPTTGETLTFEMLPQVENNWCWAAVGASVANYQDALSLSVCDLVDQFLERSDCCGQPVPGPCDITQKLSDVLKSKSNFAGWKRGNEISLSIIKQQIDNECPVPVQINVTANKTHYAVIYGYSEEPTAQMFIKDPEQVAYCEEIGETISEYGTQAKAALLYFTKKKDQT